MTDGDLENGYRFKAFRSSPRMELLPKPLSDFDDGQARSLMCVDKGKGTWYSKRYDGKWYMATCRRMLDRR